MFQLQPGPLPRRRNAEVPSAKYGPRWLLGMEYDEEQSLKEQAAGDPELSKAYAEHERQKLLAKARARRIEVQAALVAHGYRLGSSNTAEGLANLLCASHEISQEMKHNGTPHVDDGTAAHRET